jgi:hypothetical protein
MSRKLAWLIPVLLLLPLPAASGGILDVSARAEVLIRPDIEDWRCHTGDDLRWAQPGWDDHDWVACSPDSRFPLGISWRRLHVRLPEMDAAMRWSIGALLPPASVLYTNGQEVASSGRVGTRPRYFLPTYRIVSLPPSPHPGPAEVVFAIRVQHSALTRIVAVRFVTLVGSEVVDLELGKESLLQQRRQLYTFLRLAVFIPSSVVGLLALLLGAYVLRLWSAQRSHREYLWFVAIAAFFNLRPVVDLIAIGVPMDARWYQALQNGFTAELLLPPFFWTLLQRRVPPAVAVYTASIFAIRLLGTLWVPTLHTMSWLWLATIPCMLLPLGITFQEARRGSHEARVLAPTMLLYGTMITWVNLFLACQFAVLAGGPAILGQLISFPTWHLDVVRLGEVEISQMVFLLTTAVVLADRARRTSIEQARLARIFHKRVGKGRSLWHNGFA